MIKGNKVILRKKKVDDAWKDYEWKKDPELAHLDATLPINVPFSIYLTSYTDDLRYSSSGDYRFAIETLDGVHIGNCSCYNVNLLRADAELGIIIGDKEYWDKGYGTDAVQTLVNHVFKKGRINTIYLHTLEENDRAQKCFKRCGFIPCRRVSKGMYRFILMEVKKPLEQPKKDGGK